MTEHHPVRRPIPRRLLGLIRWPTPRFRVPIPRVDADPDATVVPEEHFEVVPRGRTEPFRTGEYDVVPQGRFDIVRRDYNSPVPALNLLPPGTWTRRSRLAGVELNLEAAMHLLEGRLAPRVRELKVPLEPTGEPGVFHLHNQTYEGVDAELLYAMIRDLSPRRLVELGSGYTTLLMGTACARNRAEGRPVDYVAYDPFPRRAILGEHPDGLDRLEPLGATDVPLEVFDELEAGDVLFVDTTHTVKLGSDVNHIVLEILPRLARGVVIHFHDIFLPYEYPRWWFESAGWFWAEQYLLHAFLAFNRDFRVLVPAQALAREMPERLAAVVPSFAEGVSPAAMWLAREPA